MQIHGLYLTDIGALSTRQSRDAKLPRMHEGFVFAHDVRDISNALPSKCKYTYIDVSPCIYGGERIPLIRLWWCTYGNLAASERIEIITNWSAKIILCAFEIYEENYIYQ